MTFVARFVNLLSTLGISLSPLPLHWLAGRSAITCPRLRQIQSTAKSNEVSLPLLAFLQDERGTGWEEGNESDDEHGFPRTRRGGKYKKKIKTCPNELSILVLFAWPSFFLLFFSSKTHIPTIQFLLSYCNRQIGMENRPKWKLNSAARAVQLSWRKTSQYVSHPDPIPFPSPPSS